MPNDNLPIVVLGANGQVGRALVALLGSKCIGLDRSRADLADPASLNAALDALEASAVINAAAYTAVDRAESERELAMTINGEAPGVLARWCATRAIPFVHYSTDYVFPGTGTRPWCEGDAVAPLNHYGSTKLAGERAVAEAGGRSLILRTSWVYDSRGQNFFTTMLRLARERPSLNIVGDQHGAPTYAPHIANGTINALRYAAHMSVFPGGVYHLCNEGVTTWNKFALEIFACARSRGIGIVAGEVNAISTADYPTAAMRPLNSRMNVEKLRDVLNVELPHWRNGLLECMNTYEDH